MDANATGGSWISHMGIDREIVYSLFQYNAYIPVHKHKQQNLEHCCDGVVVCVKDEDVLFSLMCMSVDIAFFFFFWLNKSSPVICASSTL